MKADKAFAVIDMPEGPAVAAWRDLRRRADLMDGAFVAVHLDAAIGAHPRHVAPPAFGKGRPRLDEAVLDQCAKRNARRRLFRLQRSTSGPTGSTTFKKRGSKQGH